VELNSKCLCGIAKETSTKSESNSLPSVFWSFTL
jgi:hypothetical protein